jgi:hypothetical protein
MPNVAHSQITRREFMFLLSAPFVAASRLD